MIGVLGLDLGKTWGGLVAAPLIGLIVGASVRRAHRWRPGWKLVAYVGSLYLGVALFGLAARVPALLDSTSDTSVSDVLVAPAAFVLGITIYPFWVVFIPLAIANNLLLGLIDSGKFRDTEASG